MRYGALVRLWRRSADTTGTDAPVWPPPPASAMVLPARPRVADPLALPTLQLDPSVRDIAGFGPEHVTLADYRHHPAIGAPVAV